jgi:hypothetical protein
MTTTVGGDPAMNDVGDFVGRTEFTTESVGSGRLVMWHRVTAQLVRCWFMGRD